MIVQQIRRRSAARLLHLRNRTSREVCNPRAFVAVQCARAMSSAGMDAFMEFEREMALKRVQQNPRPIVRIDRPIPPKEDECCKLDCPNCVLLVYQEQLLEYELSLQGATATQVPKRPELKYRISYLDEEPTAAQMRLLQQNAAMLYRIKDNHLISQPYRTKDGSLRSVRHIDLNVDDEQSHLISDNVSNIAVFVPNDTAIVDRVLKHLQVDPDLVFTIEQISQSTEMPSSGINVSRPFDKIGSAKEILTWSLDVISTPRSSLLHQLAAFATDKDDVDTLMAPNASEQLPATRPDAKITLADVFDMFPSIRIDFTTFFQFAPRNAPRYYTVSSSRRRHPDTMSITLGLRQLESQPIPRCSSYLSKLAVGDEIRASFFQSSFVFPRENRRPIMLISAGTGIAPFRAFLQDLEHERDVANSSHVHRKAYMFYGCRRSDVDFLYRDDILQAQADGSLDKLFVEYSDDPTQPRRYVQDAIVEQSALIAHHLLVDDGYIFICGSLAMGRAVKHAIVDALREHSHLGRNGGTSTVEGAKAYLSSCLDQQRVVTELW